MIIAASYIVRSGVSGVEQVIPAQHSEEVCPVGFFISVTIASALRLKMKKFAVKCG